MEDGLYLRFGGPVAPRLPSWNLFTYHLCIRRQDCYMGDIGGAAQAAANVTDTLLQDQNQREMLGRQQSFNAAQADIQRTWSAGQAQKQMDFNAAQAQITRGYQTGERVAAQDYETQMSNTQIQRRMADLRAAGVNPLLAASQIGGASSPGSSGMSGATASAGLPSGAAASGGSPLPRGPQVSGIAQSVANLALTNAQTAKTRSETPTPHYVDVTTNPDGTQSLEVNANAGHELGDQQLATQKAAIAQINSTMQLQASQISLNDALEVAKGLDNQLAGDVLTGLVKAQNAENALAATTATSGQNVMGLKTPAGNVGTWIEALRLVIGSTKGR